MRDILEKWPSFAGLARELGVEPNAVVQWGQRGLIPPAFYNAMEDSAKRLGISGVNARAMDRRRKEILEHRRVAREMAGPASGRRRAVA